MIGTRTWYGKLSSRRAEILLLERKGVGFGWVAVSLTLTGSGNVGFVCGVVGPGVGVICH
jgi:hypothetical protein